MDRRTRAALHHERGGAEWTKTHTALVILPLVLLVTTYAAFNLFAAWFGFQLGYLFGFVFKWVFWCFVVPLAIVGASGLKELFRAPASPAGNPAWLGWALLVLPLVMSFGYAFPRALPYATVGIVLVSAVIAIVNGTLEEVLWRGTYVYAFGGRPFWAWVYPSLGFGIWHLAPQSLTQASNPGGSVAFVAVAIALGLGWGWVAWRTRSIRWVVVSHVLLDFGGLGALIYLR